MPLMPAFDRPKTIETRVGEVLAGRYQLEAVLAQGGMGTVFRGRQVSLNRPVAVKLLHPSLEREQSRRFLQEAHIVAQLDHPNCVSIHDFGRTDDGRSFIAMQLLSGHSLSLETGQRHEPRRAAKIITDVLRGLEHAHSRGVIHRDLKPENLHIAHEPDGRETIKIVDFGIAKHNEGGEDDGTVTVSGLMSGTPAYMSPEQAIGIDSDGRTDIYSAGMILYELLAGRCAFEDEDAINLLQMHMTEALPPLPDDVPPELVAIVQKMCAKERSDRYQSATDALADLDVFLGTRPSGSIPIPIPALIEAKPGADAVARAQHVTKDLAPVEISTPPTLENKPIRSRGVYYAGVGLAALLFGGWFTLRTTNDGATATADEPATQPVAANVAEPPTEPAPSNDAPAAVTSAAPDLVALLASANDRSEPMPYDERHQVLEQLDGSKLSGRVDQHLQVGLDAVQADDASAPCATFGAAMEEMRKDPHEDYRPFATAARVPIVDGEACPGGDSQLEATRQALGLTGAESEAEPEPERIAAAPRKRSKSRTPAVAKRPPVPEPAPVPAAKPKTKKKKASVIPKLDDGLRGVE